MGFSAVPSRVPPPEANGLKTISRTNCLSEASFRSAGFHLFACGNPATQGKASGAFCLLTLFGQANKVRRLAGRNPPILFLLLCPDHEPKTLKQITSPSTQSLIKISRTTIT